MATLPITLAPSSEPVDKPILVGVLGPLHVMGGPGPSARMRRQVLALLALRAGEQVSIDEFCWEMWAGRPPRAALQSVQTYVMFLRRIPGLEGRVETGRCGYRLVADPFEVDALRFGVFVAQAQGESETHPLAAQDTLRAAFSLWRGAVLGEVDCGPVLAGERARIEDCRRTAIDLRFAVDLRAGRHREIVVALSAAVRGNPAREDTAAMLMLALYRSNRRADALRVFQEVRAALVEGFGLEPCPALQRLQGQILAGDPVLELEAK